METESHIDYSGYTIRVALSERVVARIAGLIELSGGFSCHGRVIQLDCFRHPFGGGNHLVCPALVLFVIRVVHPGLTKRFTDCPDQFGILHNFFGLFFELFLRAVAGFSFHARPIQAIAC